MRAACTGRARPLLEASAKFVRLKHHAAGNVPAGKSWVITVTGHGLKDPQWALRGADGADVTPRSVPFDVVTVAQALGLS